MEQLVTAPAAIRFQGTYKIPEENLEKMSKHVAKLNKTATKLKCKPIIMTVGPYEWVRKAIETTDRLTCDLSRESDQLYKVYPVDITGFAPVLDGWRFAATLQYMPGDDETLPSTILRAVPGIDADLSRFRTAKIICEQCYTDRVRKESFVVQNVYTGELRQIGRTCLKDFLGHRDPHQLAEWGEHLGAFDAYALGLGGCGSTPYYDLKEYLSWVCGQIRRSGWVSSASASIDMGTRSTGQESWYMFRSGHRADPKDRWVPNEEDDELASKIHTWAQTLLDLPESACNDYIHNLRVIVRADAVERKTKGLAASLWIAYKRHMDREAAKQAQADLIPSEWFGKVGDKVTLKVHCTSIIPLESAYGTSLLHKFIDQGSRIFVWIQSPGAKTSIDENTTIVLQGSIKDHKVWKSTRGDIKETVLTRCKVIEVL